MLRRAVALIEERVFFLGAALALEVGKNRMEALGEAQETADLIAYYCDQMEANDGYAKPMARDPLAGFASENRSVLKPHGVWLVIAPFNFPFALAGRPFRRGARRRQHGRVQGGVGDGVERAAPRRCVPRRRGAAGRLQLPERTGRIARRGADPASGRRRGATFTGSYEVGMHLVRTFAQGRWPRPCIAEMGGKNAAIVTRHGALDDAALGVMRSAFGLSGQKCSACSRVYVEHTVLADFVAALHAATAKIGVGDPTERANWMGPVIDAAAVARFEDACAQIRALGATA